MKRESLWTRSKAAIFLLSGDRTLSCPLPCGLYLATSSVAGVLSSGDRSDQMVESFGFWDAGVKKLATAFSVRDRDTAESVYIRE